MQKRRVVVTGMGVVSCFGTDVDHFYQQLLAGQSGISLIQSFPCEDWPTRFAGWIRDLDTGDFMDKKQARRVDPFIRYAMIAGKKALAMGGLQGTALAALDAERAGVIVGSGMGGMTVFYDGVETLLHKGYKRLTPFFVPFIITNMGGALLAIDLNFRGPNLSISTACATASFCIHAAAEEIRQGRADLMLSGGAEAPIHPIGVAGFVSMHALSTRNDAPTRASRPWDRDRDGFVMGEGAGVLLLESLDHAKARGAPIYAEYLGGATNCDAHHITEPRVEGITRCMELALADAQVDVHDINYINAHATSTVVGDLCEIQAIRSLLGSHVENIKVNATKSMIGHCLGAAGGLESVALIQAIRTGQLHPTMNIDHPEDLLDGIDVVPHIAKPHRVKIALKNSFGFGGHNSTLVFAPYVGD